MVGLDTFRTRTAGAWTVPKFMAITCAARRLCWNDCNMCALFVLNEHRKTMQNMQVFYAPAGHKIYISFKSYYFNGTWPVGGSTGFGIKPHWWHSNLLLLDLFTSQAPWTPGSLIQLALGSTPALNKYDLLLLGPPENLRPIFDRNL